MAKKVSAEESEIDLMDCSYDVLLSYLKDKKLSEVFKGKHPENLLKNIEADFEIYKQTKK